MDLQQEVPAGADELAAKLVGDVRQRDGLRLEVPLERVELVHEVPVELRLQVGEGRLGHLAVDLLQARDEGAAHVPELPDLGRQLGAALRRRHVEAALEVAHHPGEVLEVHRARASDLDRRHQRREAPDDGHLLRLLLGDQPQHRIHLGHGGELLELRPAAGAAPRGWRRRRGR
jgi:hypothetical protein